MSIDENEVDPIILWAEIARLRVEIKGPDGFATWKDAAIHERLLRKEADRKAREDCAAICNGFDACDPGHISEAILLSIQDDENN